MKKYLLPVSLILLAILFFLAGKIGKPRATSERECVAKMVVDSDYYRIASREIKNAQKSIDLIMFELVYYPGKNGPSNKLLNELIKARKRGVRVRVIMEGGERYLGAKFIRKVRRTADFLRFSGIMVRMDGNGQTTHAKLLIIDTTNVLLGSTNWSYYSLTKNHETNALIESKKLAQQFTNYFDELWSKSKPLN